MAKKQEKSSTLQELKLQLKNKEIGRLYFFHGEESFLLNHYLNQLKKQLLDPLTESFNFHRFTNETFEIRDFADAVENLPMMAENTFIQVDDIDLFKMNEADRNQMTEILKDIPEKPKTEPEPVKEEPVRIAQTVTKAPAPEPVQIPKAPLYRPAVLPLKLLTAEEFDKVFHPEKMI